MKNKNYRYKRRCTHCGRFFSKGHECDTRKFKNKYKCSRCGLYLDYEFFQKDRTKKYGINTRCKLCRELTGNGN